MKPGDLRRAQHGILLGLPAEQLVEFTRWLVVENLTYVEAADRLQTRFGTKVSHQTVHKFFKRYVAPEMHKQEEFIRRTVQRQWKERLATSADAGSGQKPA